MTSALLKTGSMVLPYLCAADLSDKKGYFVERGANDDTVTIVNAATDQSIGVVLKGDIAGSFNAIACPGVGGLVDVMTNSAAGTIVLGTKLMLCADGTVKQDAGTGARRIVAVAHGSAGNSEYVSARLIEPVDFAS